jgi:hypothetical protein
MRHALLALTLLAHPALAEPFEGRGYLVGCDGDAAGSGCRIVASGVIFHVRDGEGTNEGMMDLLWSEPPVTAVTISGEMGDLGDITAPLVLTSLSFPQDDPFQDTLRYLQGDWRPDGEDTPFLLRITGLEWQEWQDDELLAAFLITPSEACADGVIPGGMVLSLRQIGGDPSESACWQVEYATDTTMDLRNVTRGFGLVTYARFED